MRLDSHDRYENCRDQSYGDNLYMVFDVSLIDYGIHRLASYLTPQLIAPFLFARMFAERLI
jgi:hypothetical protein